jgi:hypothetical protein
MSNDGYVAPVNHGVLSATGNVAVGTVGGALKSVGKAALWCIGIGAVVGLLGATGLLPAITLGTGALSGFGSAIGGTVLGALGGGLAAALIAPLAGLVGAGKGAMQSHERVSMERGAARSMEAQVAAYQVMAASNDNKYNLPAQGSPMNQASPRIHAASAQEMGTMQAQQLQRA